MEEKMNMQIVLAEEEGRKRKVEAQLVEMKVPLYSYGCDKKIKKALSHLKGIYSVKVDYFKQKVTVWGICNKQDVLEAIKNKRKEARFWYLDDPHDHEMSQKLTLELPAELDMEEQRQPPAPSSSSLMKSSSSRGNYYRFSLSKSRSLSLKRWTRTFFTRSLSF